MPRASDEFIGCNAILTGAARGIGVELARSFHAPDGAVLLLDRDVVTARFLP